MGEYKKIAIFLNDDLYQEIVNIVDYRNKRILFDKEDKKVTNVEEFITGSIVQVLKWIRNQEQLSGFDELAKPFTLKNRFKEIAEAKHLKGKDLVELTGIAPSNISYILANKSQPSLDYFLRIWIALGCPPLNECLYREDEFVQ